MQISLPASLHVQPDTSNDTIAAMILDRIQVDQRLIEFLFSGNLFGFTVCLGVIHKSFHADLTVFDEAEMKAATPDQTKSFGIRRVFINGKQVLCGGELDKEALKTSGHALPSR